MHVGSGDARKVWYLPDKLLKSKSTFFTAALEGGFAEGISRIITLREENPDIFQHFVVWLYFGGDQIAASDQGSLACLWALGDRLGCPLMQDDAMCDLIYFCYNDHIDEDTLNKIYELSAPNSKIRRFAVDQCLFDVREGCPERDEFTCPYLQFAKDNEDFAQQLAEATILLSSEEPNDPNCDESPYLLAP